jgi:hypothetical protein
MVEPMGHQESAWSLARRDTASSIRSVWFWLFDTILGVIVTTGTLLSLLRWGPENTWVVTGVPSLAFIAWLSTGVLLLFAWHLFRAPYRQRDEARSTLSAHRDEPAQIAAQLSGETRAYFVSVAKQLRQGALSGNGTGREHREELRRHGLLEVKTEDAGWWDANRHKGNINCYWLTSSGGQVLDSLSPSMNTPAAY